MHDKAVCLQTRKLADIVIPGSHDSTTYSLGTSPTLDDLWHTQDENLTDRLNDGIREFDIRVEEANPVGGHGLDWYAHHGYGITDGISTWLTLHGTFSDIAEWAQKPGHDKEIILLNLTMENNTNDDASCLWFGNEMGDALMSPYEFQNYFGITDPGQLTLAQLWSLPDPQGFARVIMDNQTCLNDTSRWGNGWGPISDGQLISGFYADQVSAYGLNDPDQPDQDEGISKPVLAAAQTRALPVPGEAEPNIPGAPKVGGLYNLSIMGTPEADCLVAPKDGLSAGDAEQLLQREGLGRD